jgi:hypothetical protein
MRATYLNSISVVSVLLLTMVCMTVPTWARVDISVTQVGDTNEFIISFDTTSELNLVRAFALDIQLSNDANIIEVTGISDDYYIYPGTIRIDASGNVIDYGTALADYNDLPSGTLTGLDSNGVTIEMASLYAPTGPGSPNAPAKSGNLLSIIVSGEFCVFPTYTGCAPVSDDCCITISGNTPRAGSTGVVMEDPNEVADVYFHNICSPPPQGCMRATSPDYDDWEEWDCPACWCYARQCRGDSDGLMIGPFWVQMLDLNALVAAFNKTDTMLATIPKGICADFDHTKVGPFRVQMLDLNTFVTYFNKIETLVPECDPTHYNWWEIP